MAGKRLKAQLAKLDRMKNYPLDEALKILKDTASAKFDESVDVAINLGIDAKKSEQNVRGTAVMPRGTGKKVRVAVFAEGAQAEAARNAGADIIGFQDLADQIKQGKIDFDLAIATPEAMRVVGSLGQILGPRGLMPNPKVGTVTPNVAKAVENAKAGQVQFRTDKAGLVHCAIGKASFEVEALKENFMSLMMALNKNKPSAAKGVYLKKVTLSTTMGPGIRLDTSGL
ncbi:MAG: 50S ribosomal protein L1 [Gammaproteobacteria bacterium]|nr:50S ribosomal protein L1 [Gammaproteobacteria bacterium]MDH3371050.1 50S ribosomal protein L1 [Gammaproteobacteria bacterium]MDH3406598.1 50S ribosomal protein L1 [Gammaproteobacteria bacterium]MDH3562494.1 50S ribosomal protein L1 [Gammaproteobacteria bacterium]MDH5486202.1 50S ribosomal protein L1 [Gammaproteobacteria bacterium]